MKFAQPLAISGVVFLILVMGAGTFAYDKQGIFMAYGPANEPCADFDAIRDGRAAELSPQQQRMVEDTLKYWLSGFYTAWNYFSSDTFDISGGKKYDVMLEQLEKYCERNPDKKLVDAAIVVGHALHGTRVKNAPKK